MYSIFYYIRTYFSAFNTVFIFQTKQYLLVVDFFIVMLDIALVTDTFSLSPEPWDLISLATSYQFYFYKFRYLTSQEIK